MALHKTINIDILGTLMLVDTNKGDEYKWFITAERIVFLRSSQIGRWVYAGCFTLTGFEFSPLLAQVFEFRFTHTETVDGFNWYHGEFTIKAGVHRKAKVYPMFYATMQGFQAHFASELYGLATQSFELL